MKNEQLMEIGSTYSSSNLGNGIVTAINGKRATVKFENGTEWVIVIQTKSQKAKTAKKVAEQNAPVAEPTTTEILMWGLKTINGNIFTERAILIVNDIKHNGKGLAQQVAESVQKYKSITSKQAAIIAAAYDAKY
jgi:hypothetical protein